MATWLLFALLYPFLYSITNLIDKFLLEKKIRNFYAYSVMVGILMLLSTLLIAIFVGFSGIPRFVLLIGILGGMLNSATYFLYFYLVSSKEVSRVIGILYVFPVFVALLSRMFLGEKLSLLKYGAILIAVLGAIVLGMEKQQQQWKLTKAFWLMIFNAFLIGILDVTYKYILQYATYWQAYVMVSIPISLMIMIPAFSASIRKEVRQIVHTVPVIVASQCFGILASLSFFIAASLAPIAIVSSMGTLQPVFVFLWMLLLSLFAPAVLKEVITPHTLLYKILGLACVVAGVLILSM